MYFDAEDQLLIMDKKTENAYYYERFHYNTLVLWNRMQRIQAEIENILDKDVMLEANQFEKKLIRDLKKLDLLFNHYNAEFSDDLIDDDAHNHNQLNWNIFKTLSGLGIDRAEMQKMIDEKGLKGFN